jgi:DNA-binding transcriptional ArsR family regulator
MIKPIDRSHLEEAAAMFKALSDPGRLQTLITLAAGERNVGDLAQNERDRIGTVSARLKVLLQARLVKRRREGKAAIYSIADAHVFKLVTNAIAHAGEHH